MHPARIACFVERAIDFGFGGGDSTSSEDCVFCGSGSTSGTGKTSSGTLLLAEAVDASPPRRVKAAERAKGDAASVSTATFAIDMHTSRGRIMRIM